MRIFKSHPLLKLVNSYIIDSPQPSNLSYLWNFGSLLAVCLVIQIITGVTLAMHYNPSVLEAFNSVEHIMRDVNNGWLIRYLHSNTASAFFFLVYLHIGRGLYYGSYRSPRTLVWTLGTVIFLLMMATGFLGFFNIAQNGFNLYKKQQQQQQQQQQQLQLQFGLITHKLQSSFISIILIYKILNVLRTVLLVLILLLLVIISLALNEDKNLFDTPKDETIDKIEMNTEITKPKEDISVIYETTTEPESSDTNVDTDIPAEKKGVETLSDSDWNIYYNQVTNLNAYIFNGQVEILKIDHGKTPIDLDFFKFIVSQDSYQDLSEKERNKRIIYDYIVNVDINRDKHLKLDTGLGSPSVDSGNINEDLPTTTDIPDYMSDSDTSEYEKLIKAIRGGEGITIYVSAENSPVYTEESKGDWSKLEPLTGTIEGENTKEIVKPKQLVIITNRVEGNTPPPLPRFGVVSEEPSVNDTEAHNKWKKEVAIQKAWASKYPFFAEHYTQVAVSDSQAANEAWWLQQQDNTITYDKPSEESQEPFYLEELFGEKLYDKPKGKDNSTLGKIHYSTSSILNNKLYSVTMSGKRYYSTNIDRPSLSKELQDFISVKNIAPVYSYEELGNSNVKKQIQEDTKGLSGIYLILNKVTLDYYIGSASTNRINKRFSNHLIHLTGSKVLKNAVRKYKISRFAFLVLELFPDIVTRDNNKDLLDLEDFYLKSLLPNYNILTEAGSNFGYKHSELSRIKMKTNYSQSRRELIGNLNKNKKFSEKTISLMREKALNRVKPVYSEQALNRVKPVYSEQALNNMKKASKPIIVYNLDHTVHGKYTSIVETAKHLNCSVKTISRSLNSESKLLKKRWIINYLN
jgi:group I intron endonuclease